LNSEAEGEKMTINSTKRRYHVLASSFIAMVSMLAVPQVLAQEDEVIEEIITIGTPGGAGIQKRDVSFAVSVIDSGEIEKSADCPAAGMRPSSP
jgi:hypothetical protein